MDCSLRTVGGRDNCHAAPSAASESAPIDSSHSQQALCGIQRALHARGKAPPAASVCVRLAVAAVAEHAEAGGDEEGRGEDHANVGHDAREPLDELDEEQA